MSEGNSSKIPSNLNWPTLVLILVTGGGNWLSTHNGNQTNQYEMEQARRQVNQMFQKFDEIENRQQTTADNVAQILRFVKPSPTP